MKVKMLSFLLMIAGLATFAYGGWKIFDMNRQTDLSLTEAKEAIASSQSARSANHPSAPASFNPPPAKRQAYSIFPNWAQSFPSLKGPVPMIWKKASVIIKAAIIQNKTGKLFFQATGIRFFAEQGSWKSEIS